MTYNLVNLNPNLHISLLADRRALQRIAQELSAHPEMAKVFNESGRVRVVGLIDPNGPVIPDSEQDKIGEEVKGSLDTVLGKILEGDDGGFVKPSVVAIDVSENRDFDRSLSRVEKADLCRIGDAFYDLLRADASDIGQGWYDERQGQDHDHPWDHVLHLREVGLCRIKRIA